MSEQLELVRVLPAHVDAQMDPIYRKVEIIDGAYHHYAGNVGRPGRTGRWEVTGFRMRCGVTVDEGFDWPHRRIPPEQAHQTCDPCPKCFPQQIAGEEGRPVDPTANGAQPSSLLTGSSHGVRS